MEDVEFKPHILQRDRILNATRALGINNLVSSLEYLQRNPKEFANLLSSNQSATNLLEKGVLFHGSQHACGRLSGEKIYATSNPSYGLFLALLDLQPGGHASATVDDNKAEFTIDIGFVNGASQLKSGFLHIVPKQGFTEVGNSEFVSEVPVSVVCAIEVVCADLTFPLTVVR